MVMVASPPGTVASRWRVALVLAGAPAKEPKNLSPPPQAAVLGPSLKKAMVVPFSYFISEQWEGREVEVKSGQGYL